MTSLTEARIQRFLEHAQMSLFVHEHGHQARDPQYREILEFVDEIVDLLSEVRRERAALERIAGRWEACVASDPGTRQRMALEMCAVARQALAMPTDLPRVPAADGPGEAAHQAPRVLVAPAVM